MPVSQFNVDENSDRTNNCMTGLYPVILQYSDGVILGNTLIVVIRLQSSTDLFCLVLVTNQWPVDHNRAMGHSVSGHREIISALLYYQCVI